MTAERSGTGDIRSRLRGFIIDNFMSAGTEQDLKDDVSLMEEGIMDSTGVLNLVMFIEETFGVQVRDEELVPENLDSIDRLVSFVKRKTGRAH
ncbi:MAG: acyl carrier protein [Dehalococcoidia bacterium]|nr:acyl carrier protein [Dehalococcoidia bacterium]